MIEFSWDAMGTRWSVIVDELEFPEDLKRRIVEETASFEQRYSRFIPSSQACAFRHSTAGTYPISTEFATILRLCDEVRQVTDGAFDPAIGGLLELSGYDSSYSFTPSVEVEKFVLPRWSLAGTQLTISDPVVFDIGGIGKGYWIDEIARLLTSSNSTHYLIDGGGDMVGSSKANGQPWTVALEWPGEPDRAIGSLPLLDAGLAVSDVYKRRWGKWHHLISATKHAPTQEVLWAAVIAVDATHADMGTSQLSFSNQREGVYMYLDNAGTLHQSESWPGELF